MTPSQPEPTPCGAFVSVQAVDLLVALNSFLPPGSHIERVSVFPSDFGLERMREEQEKGPQVIFEKVKYGAPAKKGAAKLGVRLNEVEDGSEESESGDYEENEGEEGEDEGEEPEEAGEEEEEGEREEEEYDKEEGEEEEGDWEEEDDEGGGRHEGSDESEDGDVNEDKLRAYERSKLR